MNETNLDWDDLRLFLAVARGGGLAAASGATGKSAPTLGRRMVALEKRLGAELFLRLPRGYALTEEGTALLAKLSEVESRIAPLMPEPEARKPLVKLSAGTWMTHLLCRKAQAIAGGDVAIRFISADHVLDIRRRDAVIGIRNHRPDQIGLACRRVGRVAFAAYATDPQVTPWVRVMGQTPSARWVAQASAGQPVIEVTGPRNALDLARAGVARAVLPCFIGDDSNGLIRVSDPIEALAHDQWLVTHDDERFAPEVRTVIRRVEALLRDLHHPGG
ncbi:LysR family transcriptional regulator [Ruegeria sp. 2205SS24-7]|uniref:LysR family transcriptional regulator n=1 Tax=Ruegeria discodermiae TaxID=3064389 RepID=UPI002741555A|nr:LysR family transcriptional regulator [Ruegeria sp. 2205SS24-7]MDP5218101.1 LysR family transcriptional regulator [Ruegeria sp. 2205SS24-7]